MGALPSRQRGRGFTFLRAKPSFRAVARPLFQWNVFRRPAATARSLELTRGGGSSLFVLRAEHPGP